MAKNRTFFPNGPHKFVDRVDRSRTCEYCDEPKSSAQVGYCPNNSIAIKICYFPIVHRASNALVQDDIAKDVAELKISVSNLVKAVSGSSSSAGSQRNKSIQATFRNDILRRNKKIIQCASPNNDIPQKDIHACHIIDDRFKGKTFIISTFHSWIKSIMTRYLDYRKPVFSMCENCCKYRSSGDIAHRRSESCDKVEWEYVCALFNKYATTDLKQPLCDIQEDDDES